MPSDRSKLTRLPSGVPPKIFCRKVQSNWSLWLTHAPSHGACAHIDGDSVPGSGDGGSGGGGGDGANSGAASGATGGLLVVMLVVMGEMDRGRSHRCNRGDQSNLRLAAKDFGWHVWW